jgi:hypothetical protein
VRFLAEMDDVVDPAAMQGDRTVPRLGLHPALAPKPPPSNPPQSIGPMAFVVRAEAAL